MSKCATLFHIHFFLSPTFICHFLTALLRYFVAQVQGEADAGLREAWQGEQNGRDDVPEGQGVFEQRKGPVEERKGRDDREEYPWKGEIVGAAIAEV